VISAEEAKAYIKYQVGALLAFTKAQGIKLQHVKPHGAFYNMAGKDFALAKAICEGIKEVDPDLILLGLAESQHIAAAKEVGLRCASEVFADRAYMDDGSLAPRKMPGAVIHDADLAVSRTIRMIKEGVVETVTGNLLPIKADSVCVHGDNPQAVEFVKRLREALQAEGIEIVPMAELV